MPVSKPLYYIGLMSGTSADGIDLALVDFSQGKIVLTASYFQAYEQALHQKITRLYQPNDNEIDLAHSLAVELAYFFAHAIKSFLQQHNLQASDIIAIGDHGQTIRHRPNQQYGFTLQIGCNQTLATLTGIRVIGDFRKKDMVYGGQGAPLVPAFHKALFAEQNKNTFIVNIGGIANITYLPANPQHSIIGFDTGPGNALLDVWYQQHQPGRFDKNGAWGKTGQVQQQLLDKLLSEAYFSLPAPKSSGREYFHLAWLTQYLNSLNNSALKPQDIQATLVQLTATTIAQAIKNISQNANIYLCGGGALNTELSNAISQQLPSCRVAPTEQLAINGDMLEAMAFAWFAYAFDQKITGNIPSVTGASTAVVLGTEYQP